jgi:hypothetical protein
MKISVVEGRMALSDLSDDELVRDLRVICVEGNRLVARLVACLIEIDERRIDRKAACSSLFDFCVRRLGMSEGAEFRRLTAARLVKRFPSLLVRIESGEIHLSSLVLLRDHLTEANVDELVTAASGKSKREVQELLARRAPRPDVPSMIRKLPQMPRPAVSPSNVAPAPVLTPPARIEPLSPERHKVQLTVSSEVRAKLERARDLMRHRNPGGDLAVVVEQALDVLIEKLEKERLGKTTRPRRAARTAKPGTVPRAVRREVFARDGEQCTFVDPHGSRCPAKALLELDHIEPRARGGSDEAKNLRVACRAHNLFYAEQIFGKERVRTCAGESEPRSTRPALDVETLRVGLRGLVGMGFREADARRALDRVGASGPPPSIQEVFRRALAVLT